MKPVIPDYEWITYGERVIRLALIICGCVTALGALAYVILVRQPISDPRKD